MESSTEIVEPETNGNGNVALVAKPKNIPILDDGTFDYDHPKFLELLANTVAVGCTINELIMFREMCRSTRFDPFRKEIWCIVQSPDNPKYRKVQMMTGINGFFHIANKHPQYNGMTREHGPYLSERVVDGNNVEHEIFYPEYVDCTCYRKDREYPEVRRAWWREYSQPLLTRNKKLSIWAKLPTVLIDKCGDSITLRKSFPQELNGLYTPEELGLTEDAIDVTPTDEPPPQSAETENLNDARRKAREARQADPMNVGGTHPAVEDDDFIIQEDFGE